MNILHPSLPHQRAPALAPRERSADVSCLGVLMALVGLFGLAGTLATPLQGAPADLQDRSVGLAVLLLVVGLGLWRRQNWARCAAAGMFACGIHAQLSSRWLQSDVLSYFVDGLRGIHGASGAAAVGGTMLGVDRLPPADVAAAAVGLLICAAMGWFTFRLLSAQVRAEFRGSYPKSPST